MTDIDIAALAARLREYVENIRGKDEPPENYLCGQAADALEALQADLDEHEQIALDLRERAEKAEARLKMLGDKP